MPPEAPRDPWQRPGDDTDWFRPEEDASEEARQIGDERHDDGSPENGTDGDLRQRGEAAASIPADLDRLLGDEWLVLHDVSLSMNGSRPDHLVVGPPGVYSITTKHRPGTTVWVAGRDLLVDGETTDDLPTARRGALLVEEGIAWHTETEFSVTPVLAIVCREMTVEERPTDVAVMAGSDLGPWLLQCPARHHGSELGRLREGVTAWARALTAATTRS
jgi:hypothetical protein